MDEGESGIEKEKSQPRIADFFFSCSLDFTKSLADSQVKQKPQPDELRPIKSEESIHSTEDIEKKPESGSSNRQSDEDLNAPLSDSYPASIASELLKETEPTSSSSGEEFTVKKKQVTIQATDTETSNADESEKVAKPTVNGQDKLGYSQRTTSTFDFENPKFDNGYLKSHPVERKYEPTINFRYPMELGEDTFPTYLAMFVYPNDISLEYSEDREPPAKYHSFVITSATGSKTYGFCITVYQQLQGDHLDEITAVLDHWRDSTLATPDLEYVNHLQTQLLQCQQRLESLKSRVPEDQFDQMEIQDMTQELEDKINIYSSLLLPMKRTVLVKPHQLYVPISYGILSAWPWYDFFKDWLCEFTTILGKQRNGLDLDIPIERYIMNLIHEIPLPPPGKLEIAVSIGDQTLYLHRPPINSIPVIRNFSYFTFFRCLSHKHIVTLIECVLTERKIAFISNQLTLLNYAAESITNLIYPFSWPHVFIPVLPNKLMEYLNAPVPFIVGVLKCEGLEVPEDVVLVDLDKDSLRGRNPPPSLPPRERRKLMNRLSRYANITKILNIANPLSLGGTSPNRRRSLFTMIPSPPAYLSHAFPMGKHLPSPYSVISETKREEEVCNSNDSLERQDSNERPRSMSRPTPSDKSSPSSPTKEKQIVSSPTKPVATPTGIMAKFKAWNSWSQTSPSSTTSLKGSPTTAKTPIDGESSPDKADEFDEQSTVGTSTLKVSPTRNSFLSLSSFVTEPQNFVPTVLCGGHTLVEKTEVSDEQMLQKCNLCYRQVGDEDVFECTECGAYLHGDCKQLSEIRPCIRHFSDSKIQSSFFKLLTSLLKTYRNYIIYPSMGSSLSSPVSTTQPPLPDPLARRPSRTSMSTAKKRQSNMYARKRSSDLTYLVRNMNIEDINPEVLGEATEIPDVWFDNEGFLSTLDKETRAFMQHILGTQAFSQFTLARLLTTSQNDFEILFFDESIIEKFNRSKMRFGKSMTPFLNDKSLKVNMTIQCLKPYFPEGYVNTNEFSPNSWPETFDLMLFGTPRHVQSLISDSDHSMLRSHTSQIIQRSRMNQKRKQDLAKWLKNKWKYLQKNGGGHAIGIEYISDDQRREMFDSCIGQVTEILDHYQSIHLSTLSMEEVEDILNVLKEQQDILIRATDEEQLVDTPIEQEELAMVLARLVKVMTIYEDHCASLRHIGASVERLNITDERSSTRNDRFSKIYKRFSSFSPSSVVEENEESATRIRRGSSTKQDLNGSISSKASPVAPITEKMPDIEGVESPTNKQSPSAPLTQDLPFLKELGESDSAYASPEKTNFQKQASDIGFSKAYISETFGVDASESLEDVSSDKKKNRVKRKGIVADDTDDFDIGQDLLQQYINLSEQPL